MGAYSLGNHIDQTSGKTVFMYQMNITIPSYLLALAVGELVYRPIGKRAGVVCQPSVIDQCVETLGDLDKYLDTAE
jgi:aminopeptidase N